MKWLAVGVLCSLIWPAAALANRDSDAQEPLPGKLPPSTAPATASSPTVTAPPKDHKPFDVIAGLAPDVDTIDKGTVEDAKDVISEKPLDETVSFSVVTDQTITRTGREFVHGFEKIWRERDSRTHVTITITEQPSARFGSVLRVVENFALIYQVVLFPGRGDPLAVGMEAAQQAGKKASAVEAEQLLFKDLDLAPEEL